MYNVLLRHLNVLPSGCHLKSGSPLSPMRLTAFTHLTPQAPSPPGTSTRNSVAVSLFGFGMFCLFCLPFNTLSLALQETADVRINSLSDHVMFSVALEGLSKTAGGVPDALVAGFEQMRTRCARPLGLVDGTVTLTTPLPVCPPSSSMAGTIFWK